ncbi:hypothetical protein Tco_1212846 [Tanacetum coccineum]
MEKAQTESSLAKPNTNDDMNIELNKEFLMELRNEGDGKITTWKELVEKFLCKFYPLSRDGEDEMLGEGDNQGLDPLEFISRVNSIFKKHRRVDGTTKKALLHSWINESWNKEPMNDIVSSDEECEEYDYGNPPNTTTDSFFKPYLNAQEKDDIEKEDERAKRSDLAGKEINNVGEVSIIWNPINYGALGRYGVSVPADTMKNSSSIRRIQKISIRQDKKELEEFKQSIFRRQEEQKRSSKATNSIGNTL